MKSFYEMLQIMEASDLGLGDSTGVENPPQAPESPEGSAPDDQGAPSAPEMSPEASETKNYMFFSNLKVIKEKVEQMLAMDASQVDEMLSDGHDWANDHISTSKDDVEEVCNWLSSKIGEDQHSPQGPV